MKLFTKKIVKNRTIYQFLGFVYSWKIDNKYKSRYKKSYFNGLIKTDRIFKSYKYEVFHYVYLLNFKIIEKFEDGEYIYYNFLNKLIKKISVENYLEARFTKLAGKDKDYAYVLSANSGEIYLFLTYLLDSLIKKDGAKNPILIATKKYHIDLIKMIVPEIPYLHSKQLYTNIKKEKFVIKGVNFKVIFLNDHFLRVEKNISDKNFKEAHYFTEMIKTLELTEQDVKQRKIKLLSESESSMLQKTQKIGLNLENFVIISPEANSCQALPNKFWEDLIEAKQKEGFDIFVNVALDKFLLNNIDYKTCYLSYAEVYALALRAKKIYSLRSGLTEFLLQTNVPIETYYTGFFKSNLTAEVIRSGFSMNKIPNVNNNLLKEILINDPDKCDYSNI